MSQTPDNKSGIELAFKFFSLVYIFLITCGLTYNYFFYRNFGIYITEYIELNEALLLFVPLLANGFVIGAAFIVLWHFMNKALMFNEINDPLVIAQQKDFKKQMVYVALAVLIIIIIFFILCLFHLMGYRTLYMMIMISIVIVLPTIMEQVFTFFQTTWKLNSSKGLRDIFYMLIVFLSIVVWMSYSRTERVFRKGGYKAFEISFSNNDSIFKSDSNTYLLGRTSNYLFLYDFKKEQSRVINVKDIKEFISSNK